MQIMMKDRNYSGQRSPTLNTVLMIEDTIKKSEELLTIGKLKRILPKQVMHQTLMAVIDYLEYSGKIVIHENKILWTFKPQSKLKKNSRVECKMKTYRGKIKKKISVKLVGDAEKAFEELN